MATSIDDPTSNTSCLVQCNPTGDVPGDMTYETPDSTFKNKCKGTSNRADYLYQFKILSNKAKGETLSVKDHGNKIVTVEVKRPATIMDLTKKKQSGGVGFFQMMPREINVIAHIFIKYTLPVRVKVHKAQIVHADEYILINMIKILELPGGQNVDEPITDMVIEDIEDKEEEQSDDGKSSEGAVDGTEIDSNKEEDIPSSSFFCHGVEDIYENIDLIFAPLDQSLNQPEGRPSPIPGTSENEGSHDWSCFESPERRGVSRWCDITDDLSAASMEQGAADDTAEKLSLVVKGEPHIYSTIQIYAIKNYGLKTKYGSYELYLTSKAHPSEVSVHLFAEGHIFVSVDNQGQGSRSNITADCHFCSKILMPEDADVLKTEVYRLKDEIILKTPRKQPGKIVKFFNSGERSRKVPLLRI